MLYRSVSPVRDSGRPPTPPRSPRRAAQAAKSSPREQEWGTAHGGEGPSMQSGTAVEDYVSLLPPGGVDGHVSSPSSSPPTSSVSPNHQVRIYLLTCRHTVYDSAWHTHTVHIFVLQNMVSKVSPVCLDRSQSSTSPTRFHLVALVVQEAVPSSLPLLLPQHQHQKVWLVGRKPSAHLRSKNRSFECALSQLQSVSSVGSQESFH